MLLTVHGHMQLRSHVWHPQLSNKGQLYRDMGGVVWRKSQGRPRRVNNINCVNSTQILNWSLTKLVGRPPNSCWKPKEKEKAFSFRAQNGWQLEESGPQEWKPVFRGLPGSRGSTNIYYNICRGLSQNQGALPTCTMIFIKCPTWSWRYGSVLKRM